MVVPALDELCARSPALYTIAPTRSFLDGLAAYLLKQHEGNPAGLADVTIFLPTRRAGRSLAEAFLRQAGPSPAATLLPVIRTLGDIGEDDTLLADLTVPQADLPPPLTPIERRLTLARLVFQRQAAEQANGGPAPSWTTALAAADELSRLLDSFYTEQVSFDALETLVPERFAHHWQLSIDFLKIVTDLWPAHLSAHGRLDPADYRRRTIDALTALWDGDAGGTTPSHPVILAGSTGSMPAVARLMKVIAAMPSGCVILPGLDTQLDEAAWTEIEDPHPQAGLKYLLERHFTETPWYDVPDWPDANNGSEKRADRRALISLALRPAEATGDWLERLEAFRSRTDIADALSGLSLCEAMDEEAEAQAIAIALREALETEKKTAILVTPDRPLARRVSARLARWDIALDDSAGVPFANTPRGNFLRLTAAWLEAPHDPQALLGLLKHPLARAGMAAEEYLPAVSAIDRALRGRPPGRGFASLKERLRNGAEWDALSRDDDGEEREADHWPVIRPLIERLEEIAAPFAEERLPLQERISRHIAAAEALAERPDEPGTDILWARADGEAGSQLLTALHEQSGLLPDSESAAYSDIFTALITGTPVRPQGQGHPRLRILGPLEARLQQADLVILGGLNEGIWPDDSETDPFLSRPMRRELGLPSPERQIGLAAHDFAQLACAPEVLLTRARRSGRAPAKPSRWIVRLKNVLTATKTLESVDVTHKLEGWSHALDDAGLPQPATAPKPTPPTDARPDTFYVTAIEKLLRDPYSIYAKYVLGLRKLSPLSDDQMLAMRGRFYHHLFARFAIEHSDGMPGNPIAILTAYADELFDKAGLEPAVRAFWQTRMEDSFNWFIGYHEERLSQGTPLIIEGQGAASLDIAGRTMTLRARADRIDQLADGSLFIQDYKTGEPPTDRQAEKFSPQLQLTGLIAERGGFGLSPKGEPRISGYAYVKVLNRTARTKDTIATGDDAREKLEEAESAIIELLTQFNNPDQPYLSQPRPFYRDDYGDYDHLARRGEWSTGGESE
ncbi:double-strand break repair protein AddB [Parvularcula flava]|uniref:Double-strand break repair protein AddB n=1 Tax=Aquisalinus luteolus TaxID=1566827 RepID=A0A8J3A2F4_9PROT|nr:double-strand break repair protein AddB [Aquisalinus luteolus]NHK28279.1 double-strand break repair protein AddB [Aquisalinus luteolus]GGH98003.1 double-strand break repair protein AddB [Aquisalinus luteolus]